ncbi:hypothetical protein AB4Z09_13625 [Rhodococcus sp. TAF43]
MTESVTGSCSSPGNLAPRIYFYVDNIATKVHFWFFGPHKHMPNTKT